MTVENGQSIPGVEVMARMVEAHFRRLGVTALVTSASLSSNRDTVDMKVSIIKYDFIKLEFVLADKP